MHFIFIPYGKRSELNLMFRDMESQKHKLLLKKKNEKRNVWIEGSIRLLPFGVIEYVCPKEDADTVMHTLDFETSRYGVNFLILSFLRKMLKCEKIPRYKKTNYYLWIRNNVNIIPLGIRKDIEITDEAGNYKGWTHEAL